MMKFDFDVENFETMKEFEGKKMRQLDDELQEELPSTRFNLSIETFAAASGTFYLEPDCYDELEVVAHVERIDVEETHRGMGHSRELLSEIAKKCTKIHAAAESESAANFWRHMGASEVFDGDWSYLDVGYGVFELSTRNFLD